jgi:hypothetical protein
MSTQTADNLIRAARASIWSRFADWACRTLDRVPLYFADIDPALLRLMPPF